MLMPRLHFSVRLFTIAAMVCAAATFFAGVGAMASARPAATQESRKDYLTATESDKIRDAYEPGDKIKLFIQFADDRLKKFQYELNRKTPEGRRAEILNGLLNAYQSCVDDAADQINLAREKQVDIRPALKIMDAKTKDFLAVLDKLNQAGGPEFDTYKENLDDALEGTHDAINDVTEAQKELTPVPVRRKPN
jgi:hypothetical protein